MAPRSTTRDNDGVTDRHNFLDEAPPTEAREVSYAEDRESDGYVWNATRLWSWRPDFESGFGELRACLAEDSALTDREKAILHSTAASARKDSYCSLAWGQRLAKLIDDETAAQVLADASPTGLSEREAALTEWARQVVRDSNATTPEDVERLREAGLTDREIFEATALVALRLAFSTINGALGAAPDKQLADAAPEPVRAAVDYGRLPSAESSPA